MPKYPCICCGENIVHIEGTECVLCKIDCHGEMCRKLGEMWVLYELAIQNIKAEKNINCKHCIKHHNRYKENGM